MVRHGLYVVLILVAGIGFANKGAVCADAEKPLSSDCPVIPEVKQGPVIDGVLDDDAWNNAPEFEIGFLDKNQKGKPGNKTTVKMVTDEKNIYFAFWCEEKHPDGPLLMDPGSHFTIGRHAKSDAAKKHSICDWVKVSMDFGRFGKSQYYFIYGNAGGPFVRKWYMAKAGDAFYRHNVNWRKPVSGIALKSIHGKFKAQEGSWTFEAKIGFDDILLYPKNGIPKTIGIEFYRLRWGNDRNRLKEVIAMEEDGPSYCQNIEKYLFSWKGKRVIKGQKTSVWGGHPMEMGFVRLAVGNLENRLVRKELTTSIMKRMKKTYAYTDEELCAPRMEIWQDLGNLERNYDQTPAKIMNTPAIGGPGKNPAFTGQPVVKPVKDGFQVSFAVNEPTDVTVLIKNEKGETVRHLGSGVLGPNAPEPFLKDTLKQTVVWDGKDDNGKPIEPGKYNIAVNLGLEPAFDKLIGWNPQAMINTISSIGVDTKGHLYIGYGFLPDRGAGGWRLLSFNRKGEFQSQIVPFPRLPYDKVKGFGVVKTRGDEWVPTLYGPISKRGFYPESFNVNGSQSIPVTRDGRILLVNSDKGHWETTKITRRQIIIVNKDGSCPGDKAPAFYFSRYHFTGKVSVALSPDDKYAYLVSMRRMDYGRQVYKNSPYHAVLRIDLTGSGEHEGGFAEAFIGEIGKPGNDETHLNYPECLAVDSAGNIYVADRENNRVCAFDKNAKFITAINISHPEWIAVHSKTGEIYVFSRDPKKNAVLVKYKSLSDPERVAAIVLPKRRGHRASPNVLGALDVSGDKPLIWLKDTISAGFMKHPALITDMGTSFELSGDPLGTLAKNRAHSRVSMLLDGTELLHVDRRNEELYVQGHQIWDGRSGKYLREFAVKGWKLKLSPELAVDRNTGFIYAAWQTQVRRYTPDGHDALFPSGVSFLPQTLRGHSSPHRGHDITRNGDVYVLHHYDSHGNGSGCVSRYGSDGIVKDYQFVNIPVVSAGVKVDKKGFVYVASTVRTGEYPREFENLPKPKLFIDPRGNYRQSYGGIMKFRPEGGEVTFDKNGPLVAGRNYHNNIEKVKTAGVVWIHPWISPLINRAGLVRCSCEIPRFDLDDSDRLFYPDVLRMRIGVLDSNGNTIINIGGYGNMNDRGPDIRFGWPLAVAVSDEALYVADTNNCRLTRIKLGYKVKETCMAEIKGGDKK